MSQGQAQPPRRSIPRFISGPTQTVTKLNSMVDAINGLRAANNAPIQQIGDPINTFTAKITGGDNTDGYGWSQVVLDKTGEWVVLPDGLVSTSQGVAYELNGSSSVPDDAIVDMVLYIDQTGATNYRFSYSSASLSNFTAKITGNSSGNYSWEEIEETGAGTWATKSGGRSGTTTTNAATELNNSTASYTNQRVIMYEAADTSGVLRYFFVLQTSLPFVVKAKVDGGSNGTSSTTCTFTYTVKNLDETVTLGTLVQSVQTRPPVGAVVGNISGFGYAMAFYSAAGSLLLIDANEQLDTEFCEPA